MNCDEPRGEKEEGFSSAIPADRFRRNNVFPPSSDEDESGGNNQDWPSSS